MAKRGMEALTQTINDALRRIPPWLETVRRPGLPYGRYRYFPSSTREWCAYASMEGLLIEQFLGMDRDWTVSRRREALDGLIACQSPDGYFHCPGCQADPRDPRQRCSEDNADGLTFKLAMFLYGCGETPRYPLPQGRTAMAIGGVDGWLADVFAGENPYSAGSTVWKACGMPALRRLSQGREPMSDPLVAAIVNWLVRNQDPDSGLWFPRGDLLNGVNGLLKMRFGTFDLTGIEIPRPERIVRTILGIQRGDGCFGGACCDWNAAGLLADLGLRLPGYRDDIVAAYRRLLPGVLAKQRPSGGFAASRHETEEAGVKYTFVNLCGLLCMAAFCSGDEWPIDRVFFKPSRERLLGRNTA